VSENVARYVSAGVLQNRLWRLQWCGNSSLGQRQCGPQGHNLDVGVARFRKFVRIAVNKTCGVELFFCINFNGKFIIKQYVIYVFVFTDAPAVHNVRYYPCCKEPYPDVTFRLTLRRRPLYYNLYVIVPTGAVAALTLLAFLLPPDSGEKIGLGQQLIAHSILESLLHYCL